MTGLRRELGSLEAYATLIGILVGAGIFRVTSDASRATGAGVVVAHLLLAPVVLASTVAYAVFLSTPLGREPGGEALHLARTFRRPALGFVAAWLKLVSYLGAGAYLVTALAEQVPGLEGAALRVAALAALAAFGVLHLSGSRGFARLQVGMCALLGLSILVLVVPGLFAVERANLTPVLPRGVGGLVEALPPLFFAYAGFESLAQTAGEVQDSTARLPRVFLRGVALTALIFLAMSLVAFGSLPASVLEDSTTPMTDAARTYLPAGAEWIVTGGAVLAIATSVNATMLVPARLAYGLAREGLMPRAFARVHPSRGVPDVGIAVSFGLVAFLVATDRTQVALGIAVLALVSLYGLHSAALLLLPRANPELLAQATTRLPRGVQVLGAGVSTLAMAAIVAAQVWMDARSEAPWTSATGLLVLWGLLGAALFALGRVRRRRRIEVE